MAIIVEPNKLGKANEEDFVSFEKLIGIKLPKDFKDFILETNGGIPTPDCFSVYDGEETWETNIYFFGLYKELYELYSLPYNYNEYRGMILNNLIPIGNDYSGNLICIDINKNNFGKIYFSHHDYFSYNDEKPTNFGTYFIANSFAEFFSSLKESGE